ncbi:hypothetical protein BG004_002104 [Podila humilis]|nr:hypothetical protein BG004_002104 [Podila humilis]
MIATTVAMARIGGSDSNMASIKGWKTTNKEVWSKNALEHRYNRGEPDLVCKKASSGLPEEESTIDSLLPLKSNGQWFLQSQNFVGDYFSQVGWKKRVEPSQHEIEKGYRSGILSTDEQTWFMKRGRNHGGKRTHDLTGYRIR